MYFISVKMAGNKTWYASQVFYMDENEDVGVTVHFIGSLSPYRIPYLDQDWTARAALPGDISQGEILVNRSN